MPKANLLTDHQRSSCSMRSKSVPATTTGWPSLVRATTSAKGAATPRACKNGFHVRESVGGKGSAVFADENNVRAVVAELAPQLRLHIDVKVQHRRSDRRRHDHGKQR